MLMLMLMLTLTPGGPAEAPSATTPSYRRMPVSTPFSQPIDITQKTLQSIRNNACPARIVTPSVTAAQH
jgi:hypothetical protein